MAISLNRIRSLKIWQVGLLVVVLLVAGGAAYTAYARSTSADAGSLKENQQLFKVAFGDLVDQVSTNGSLVFPEKEALSFGTEGIVSELLVEEGQRVPQGEVLAKLDPLTVSSLHREVAQVRLDLQAAEELLKETRQGHTPLELAQLREAVANADFQVQEAQEALEDAQVPHTAEQIQAQEELLAAARVTLRDAKDSLAELSPDNRLRYAEAVQLKAAAKAELENAQLLAEAIQSRADWEVALEEAGTALRVYEDRNSLLNQYRSEKDEALESLEKAQRKLADLLEAEAETGGLQSHIRGQKELLKLVQESYDMAQEKVAAAEQLDADMTLAKASLNSAKDELERLEREAIAYLTEIGFGVEYGSSSTVLHKWTTDVNLRMYGSPTPTDVATLTQVVTELNELIRGIELTLNDGPADVEVHFVPESQFQSIEPHYQPVNYGFFRVWWDHGGTMVGPWRGHLSRPNLGRLRGHNPAGTFPPDQRGNYSKSGSVPGLLEISRQHLLPGVDRYRRVRLHRWPHHPTALPTPTPARDDQARGARPSLVGLAGPDLCRRPTAQLPATIAKTTSRQYPGAGTGD